jgi:chromosome segregation ATPase
LQENNIDELRNQLTQVKSEAKRREDRVQGYRRDIENIEAWLDANSELPDMQQFQAPLSEIQLLIREKDAELTENNGKIDEIQDDIKRVYREKVHAENE